MIEIREGRIVEQIAAQSSEANAANLAIGPSVDSAIAPYGALRRRRVSGSDEANELRRELDITPENEHAWEQRVQNQVGAFEQHERGAAQTAVQYLGHVGRAAIAHENELA